MPQSIDAHQWYTGGKKTKQGWQWNKFAANNNVNKQKSPNTANKRMSAFKTKKSAVDFGIWFPGKDCEISVAFSEIWEFQISFL